LHKRRRNSAQRIINKVPQRAVGPVRHLARQAVRHAGAKADKATGKQQKPIAREGAAQQHKQELRQKRAGHKPQKPAAEGRCAKAKQELCRQRGRPFGARRAAQRIQRQAGKPARRIQAKQHPGAPQRPRAHFKTTLRGKQPGREIVKLIGKQQQKRMQPHRFSRKASGHKPEHGKAYQRQGPCGKCVAAHKAPPFLCGVRFPAARRRPAPAGRLRGPHVQRYRFIQ